MDNQITENKLETPYAEEVNLQPLKVESNDYNEIVGNLEGMDDDVKRPQNIGPSTTTEKEEQQQQPVAPPPKPHGSPSQSHEEVPLRSASASIPNDVPQVGTYKLETVNEIVQKLQGVVDLLLIGTQQELAQEKVTSSKSIENTKHASKFSLRSLFHSTSGGDSGLLKETKDPKRLTNPPVTSSSSSPPPELDHDFVFVPSNKEEAQEKKALDKLEKSETKLHKKSAGIESKIKSLQQQIDELQVELEAERHNIRTADEAILKRRMDLLRLKEKNDTDRQEKDRVAREKAEKDQVAKQKAEREKVDSSQTELEGHGHTQAQYFPNQ